MKYNAVPVFALDPDYTWSDMENAMASSAEYQSSKLGKILPLMFFAPLTEPENLDTWEPMKTLPNHLLIVSLERAVDATIVKALKQAEDVLGETRHAVTCPSIRIDFDRPLSHLYEQMSAAEVQAYSFTNSGKDDPSFFFLRGAPAVQAFGAALRKVTSKVS